MIFNLTVHSDIKISDAEKKIVSTILESAAIGRIDFRTTQNHKKRLSSRFLNYLLTLEFKKYNVFLSSQDSIQRNKLYKVSSDNQRSKESIIRQEIYLSDIGNKEPDRDGYYIKMENNTSSLHLHILECVMMRKDFVTFSLVESKDLKFQEPITISCQVSELYVASLARVYSAIIYKIISRIKDSE